MSESIQLHCFTLGPFAQNCYLLVGPSGRRAALVDPGFDSDMLLEPLQERGLELEWIVNTHGHVDHVAGNRFFKERSNARLIIHPADAGLLGQVQSHSGMFGLQAENSPPPDDEFEEGRPFVFDGVEMRVIHTPGHSPGSVCLAWDSRLLVGDTLFQGSVGRSDLPGGSHELLIASIRQKLFELPGETVCFPGHGPETTIAEERQNNPFVSDRAAGALFRGRT
jgi:glyoxylase-like metal-dependent hydrolase (beta-lactamase superfamily II)